MRIGSLFSGYGGLDVGVQQVLGGDVAWHVEFDEAPSRILEHHWPDVPNLGDVTAITTWTAVEPVDVLCGGFPCQDVSLAGLRRGLRPGTRSGLWSHFAAAIDGLRPPLVVIENVRGLLSAEAHSDLESDAWDLGAPARRGGPALRALGAVLGDLADLGYDAEWLGLRAADAGAPHGRFRVFVVARPAEHSDGRGCSADSTIHSSPRATRGDDARRAGDALADARNDRRECHQERDSAANNDRRALRDDADRRDASDTADQRRERPGRSRDRRTEPEYRRDAAPDALGGDGERRRGPGRVVGPVGVPRGPDRPTADAGRDAARDLGEAAREWGPFAPAVRRWEAVLGRVAPAPTSTSARGVEQLSPVFVEWMMGLPAGHVTAPEIGLTRRQQLKALGNGVVPQQAALAVRTLLAR